MKKNILLTLTLFMSFNSYSLFGIENIDRCSNYLNEYNNFLSNRTGLNEVFREFAQGVELSNYKEDVANISKEELPILLAAVVGQCSKYKKNGIDLKLSNAINDVMKELKK